MNIYLDDNQLSPALAGMLRRAGHSVIHPRDIGLLGASDTRHLERAIRAGLVVLTSDSIDFWELSDLVVTCGGHHPGILVIRYDNNRKRDMEPKHVVRAVGKLERSGVPIADEVTILNQWR